MCLRARRRCTRQCPDDCDRGPNAQTRRGGCGRPALRRPALSQDHVVDGDYEDLANSELVMITAGINEKAGGAIDRSDPKGRLRLFDTNAEIYRDIVPRIVRAAPRAVILLSPAGSARRHRPHECRA
jgi:hypothetical protein